MGHYVGARYVPKFANPLEWAENTAYEAMTVVSYNNNSYTSKVPVPPTVGNPANNPKYWALTGNYNAQVEKLDANITEQGSSIKVLEQSKYYITPEEFGAIGDGITDDSEALQKTFNYAVTNNVPIRCKSKNYMSSKEITVTGTIEINGCGCTFSFPNTNGIICSDVCSQSKFYNFELNGNGNNNNTGLTIAGQHIFIENVSINLFGTGLYFNTDLTTANQTGTIIHNTHIRYCKEYGMRLGSENNGRGTDITISDCTIASAGTGLYIGSAIGDLISNVHLWGGYNTAINLYNGSLTEFNNIYIEPCASGTKNMVLIHSLRGITFNNVTAVTSDAQNVFFFSGDGTEHIISNINLRTDGTNTPYLVHSDHAALRTIYFSNIIAPRGGSFEYINPNDYKYLTATVNGTRKTVYNQLSILDNQLLTGITAIKINPHTNVNAIIPANYTSNTSSNITLLVVLGSRTGDDGTDSGMCLITVFQKTNGALSNATITNIRECYGLTVTASVNEGNITVNVASTGPTGNATIIPMIKTSA